MSSRQEKKPARRVIGKIVQSYIARENELQARREGVAEMKRKEIYAVWDQLSTRNQAAQARQQLNENRFEEIKQLETEVKVRRNARLKDYYTRLEESYDERLRQRGLAYIKETQH